MDASDLRIALISGNYNYVRDGANQSLNRLVGYLLRQGAKVRVYAPTVENPAFEPTGDLVSLPSVPIPGRGEYRFPLGLPRKVRKDLEEFAPNVVHIASPDISSHRAVTWARKRGIPAIASVHTRFETYLEYYHLQMFEPYMRAALRRLYRRCDALIAPAQSTVAVLEAQRMNDEIHIWSRGVDREQFNPERRDMEWRRSLGIRDEEFLVAFLGRIVIEKGLDVFADVIARLKKTTPDARVLVIGKGPAKPWFEQHLPDDAVFIGQVTGAELARAVASSDVLLNPSVTEAFGNVTLEAMACGLPVVATAATGTNSLVENGENGFLSSPGDNQGLADSLARYAADPELAARHGQEGLRRARTRDWDRINSAVVDVYCRVIERRRSQD
ncbi:glycosyltransferase family 4 protein [Sphingomicrobium lutaoense]|uniref:Glycosyltransferase involved in cell wall biosynthesis n=1 Tax=Sphingomicrobium lutaoense TaxID=515949 RepID=A0A839YSB4_9SPHN|nr:glycosyltransferase family 1 protein [Sphingomicrobium lutaoense]MBB3763181.1 glycosyltransferase involved in cell wall biosynthesis [Sphingomicrobium lutaoense]